MDEVKDADEVVKDVSEDAHVQATTYLRAH